METDTKAVQASKRKLTKKELLALPTDVAMQTVTLATSGFSLVAALAWNELIKSIIERYIRPHLGAGSEIITLTIYALVTTGIAVAVGMQLGKIKRTLERLKQI